MEGKQVNGVTIIFFDLRVTVFLPADNAFLPDVILKVDVGKLSFVFTDVRKCVIELVLDIWYPFWKLGRISIGVELGLPNFFLFYLYRSKKHCDFST